MSTTLETTKNEEFAAITAAALNDIFLDEEVFEAVDNGDGNYHIVILNREIGPIGRERFIDSIKAIRTTYLIMKGVLPIKENV